MMFIKSKFLHRIPNQINFERQMGDAKFTWKHPPHRTKCLQTVRPMRPQLITADSPLQVLKYFCFWFHFNFNLFQFCFANKNALTLVAILPTTKRSFFCQIQRFHHVVLDIPNRYRHHRIYIFDRISQHSERVSHVLCNSKRSVHWIK